MLQNSYCGNIIYFLCHNFNRTTLSIYQTRLSSKPPQPRWYQEVLRRALFRLDGLDEDLGLSTKFLPSVILADVGSNYVPGTLTRAYFLLLEEKVLL